MKNKIIMNVDGNAKLHCYLVFGNRKHYLFTQPYTKEVYEYFKNGRTEEELRRYNKWNRNSRLDKTIEKIPMYI